MERKLATVYQGVLRDLELEPPAYIRRLKQTLAAIETLNRDRGKDAQIDVRFYDEKPTMRAVIFDEVMLVSPWGARVDVAEVPYLEVARKSDTPTFYETFRRSFARLWGSAIKQVLA